MSPTEYLLICLGEECAEVIKDASKALRFGPNNSETCMDAPNHEAIGAELNDVIAVFAELTERGFFHGDPFDPAEVEAKRARLRAYMEAACT